jgi:hypothetical protein
MSVASNRIRSLMPLVAVVATVVSALFGPAVHLLQHTANAGDTAARTCACVHGPATTVPDCPDDASGNKTPDPSKSRHDPSHCSICLTYLLQTPAFEQTPVLEVLPAESRRILPQNTIGSGNSLSISAARGPPCGSSADLMLVS